MLELRKFTRKGNQEKNGKQWKIALSPEPDAATQDAGTKDAGAQARLGNTESPS